MEREHAARPTSCPVQSLRAELEHGTRGCAVRAQSTIEAVVFGRGEHHLGREGSARCDVQSRAGVGATMHYLELAGALIDDVHATAVTARLAP